MKKIFETDFAPEVIQEDGVQVVYFYHPNSDYPDANNNMLRELYKTYSGVSFFNINMLHAETLCERYGISGPSVLIFEDGALQDLLQGSIAKEKVESRLETLSSRLRATA
jgi:thioredoxin-like negative regulator of GroEL